MDRACTDCQRHDLSGRLATFLLVWGLPVAAGSASLLLPAWLSAATWSIAFAWMGTACLVNAKRCGRLHCYVSGPVLLLGALLTALVGLGLLDFGTHGLTATVLATLALMASTFALELFRGRYPRRRAR